MMRFSCPHCAKPGIGLVAKFYIGPKKPATCGVCGEKSGVRDLLAILSLVPLFMGILLALFFEPGLARYVSGIAGFLAYALCFAACVPLVRKS